MAENNRPLLSIVVPVYNESAVLSLFHDKLMEVLKRVDPSVVYEIIYCNDGSNDDTAAIIHNLRAENPHVRLLSFTRNFGKEIAVSAGIAAATGQAIITLDADGQHPVELIPEFTKHWQAGHKVVVGFRTSNQKEGFIKRYGSKLFYGLFNRFMGVKLVAGTTDFRLIDRSVQQEFVRLPERNRVTRGLIDWLGYEPDYIRFKANARLAGEAGYSFRKLFKLAIDHVISLSLSPLFLVAYIGAIVLPLSTLIGLVMLVNVIIGDPLSLHATASAYVIIFMLFLIGVLLLSQGIIGLYLSRIHNETQGRPLYIIDTDKTEGIS